MTRSVPSAYLLPFSYLEAMCESNAFVIGPEGKKEAMRDVSKISIDGTKAVLIDIVGQKRILTGVRVKEMDLVGHEIVFEKV